MVSATPAIAKLKDVELMARDFIKGKVRINNEVYKTRSYFLLLSIEPIPRFSDTVSFYVTDFTSHSQCCREDRHHERSEEALNLNLRMDQVVRLIVHEDHLDTLSDQYQAAFDGCKLNLKKMWQGNRKQGLNVEDKVIIFGVTCQWRSFENKLEPYTFDFNIVEYDELQEKKQQVTGDLYRNILKQTKFVQLNAELINKVIPKDFVKSPSIATSAPSIKTAPPQAIPGLKIRSKYHNNQLSAPATGNAVEPARQDVSTSITNKPDTTSSSKKAAQEFFISSDSSIPELSSYDEDSQSRYSDPLVEPEKQVGDVGDNVGAEVELIKDSIATPPARKQSLTGIENKNNNKRKKKKKDWDHHNLSPPKTSPLGSSPNTVSSKITPQKRKLEETLNDSRSPIKPGFHSIRQLRDMTMEKDDKIYKTTCKIVGTVPNNWSLLCGEAFDDKHCSKSSGTNKIIMHELEIILADVNMEVDKDNIINDKDVLSVYLNGWDILKFLHLKNVDEAYVNIGKLQKQLDTQGLITAQGKPLELDLDLFKVRRKIGNDSQHQVIWKANIAV
ncbi:uncharacterized protein LODBEIA_P29420 [Lodderomyces beijingensis]|uniref:Telomeric single stranded DNA binding POT1/Cdc13 domain-containing protein n=1 Tax=Lodderomyces beijingensis TaxID=1775926 RepID=A0ABP0ZM46_9ASCO